MLAVLAAATPLAFLLDLTYPSVGESGTSLLAMVVLALVIRHLSGPDKPFFRGHDGYQLQGLCIAYARRLRIPVGLIRLIWVVLLIKDPAGTFAAYLISSLFIPWKAPALAEDVHAA